MATMMAPEEQMNLLIIGRIVEREFPTFSFSNLEELRIFLNNSLGTNIQTGDTLGAVLNDINAALVKKAYDRSIGVVG